MISKLILHFNAYSNKRRTLKGLSKAMNIPSGTIETELKNHPKMFVEARGCKGDMWQLK